MECHKIKEKHTNGIVTGQHEYEQNFSCAVNFFLAFLLTEPNLISK